MAKKRYPVPKMPKNHQQAHGPLLSPANLLRFLSSRQVLLVLLCCTTVALLSQNQKILFKNYSTLPRGYKPYFNILNLSAESHSPLNSNWTGKYVLSHPLETDCKIPVLYPDDPNIQGYVKHARKLICVKQQPEWSYMDKDGFIYVQPDYANKTWTKNPSCRYRTIGGSLYPSITKFTYLSNWTDLKPTEDGHGTWIPEDQFIVECRDPSKNKSLPAEHINYYAHFGDRPEKDFQSAEDQLSLNILVLDSTALNQFKRHMWKTWRYMTEELGFEWLEGLNKVADNSEVNLIPVLAGLRYENQSRDMPSDIMPMEYKEKLLVLETLNYVWDEYKNHSCATMLNDAIGHFSRGLFHYPWKQNRGWRVKPTDFYFRPWYVNIYKNLVEKGSSYCVGNYPLYRLHYNLVEGFINKFAEKCHFSFNFFTQLTHNDPNGLEMFDNELHDMLKSFKLNGKLENTALVIMGDHGNRINNIRASFIGRLEERMPLFALYLPEKFKAANPDLVRHFRANKHRLTSNYDVYQTLMDIAQFGKTPTVKRSGRGQSLFTPISTKRTCKDANIPENHCTCLVPGRKIRDPAAKELQDCSKRLLNWLKVHMTGPKCRKRDISIETLSHKQWTESQMVRHGLRTQNADALALLKSIAATEIDYIELTVEVYPYMGLQLLARFQYPKKFPEKTRLNVEPLILAGQENCGCPGAKTVEQFCNC